MPGPCNPTFDKLAHELGDFGCETAKIVNIRAPWNLTNATLPVVEALFIAGAVYALVHAIRRYRAGDPTIVSLWFASIVYLLIIEPPLYFPDKMGLPGADDIVFVHNVFTVELLWDRLPLYIVALYPALLTLAFEVVRSLGIFRRRNVLVAAAAVGFVHHAFYEVFDQLGPQLRWWIWNPAADTNHPTIGSVPTTSAVVFAAVAPIALAAMVYALVGRKADRGEAVRGGRLVGYTVAAGLAMLVASAIAGLPGQLTNSSDPNDPVQIAALFVELGALLLVGGSALVKAWRERGDLGFEPPRESINYVRYFGTAFLLVFAFLWATALPDFFGAVRGVTSDGTPIGNWPFTVAVALAALGCLVITVPLKTTERVNENTF